MGLFADWWAEEVEIIHRQALERPVRIAERRARRAQRQAVAALAQLRLEEARLAAERATAVRDAARGRINVVRSESAGRAQIEPRRG